MTERQRREIAYHTHFAKRHQCKVSQPVDLSVLGPQSRWWNAYWTTYKQLLEFKLAGKSVLVPGCGFADDAIRLTHLRANVHAFDISSEIIQIAKQRAALFAAGPITFTVMAAEQLAYPDNFFDVVLFVDILHHVEISRAIQEIRRVLKPDAVVIGDELYTHSSIQRIRENPFVTRFLYPRMVKFIYDTDQPYITADEHKINETEFKIVTYCLQNVKVRYFLGMSSRFFPERIQPATKIDRFLLACLGPLGRFFAGRVVFIGNLRKL